VSRKLGAIQGYSSTKDQANTTDLQLVQIKDRMERLTDALIDRLIEQDVFNSRRQSLLLEKAKLEEIKATDTKKRTDRWHVQNFLEHTKTVVDTYLLAKPGEKRQFIKLATSNRTVAGKNIYLEPANWLLAIEDILSVSCGDPHRPTSRTSPHFDDAKMEKLIEVSRSTSLPKNTDIVGNRPLIAPGNVSNK